MNWELFSNRKNTLPTFTGEFSLAVTDCQKYIQGGYNDPYIPVYASEESCKYYNSDFSTFTEEYKYFLREYFLSQIEPYQYGGNGIGWFFWTGKTLDNCAPEWDFLFLIENDIISSDLCIKTNVCNSWRNVHNKSKSNAIFVEKPRIRHNSW